MVSWQLFTFKSPILEKMWKLFSKMGVFGWLMFNFVDKLGFKKLVYLFFDFVGKIVIISVKMLFTGFCVIPLWNSMLTNVKIHSFKVFVGPRKHIPILTESLH